MLPKSLPVFREITKWGPQDPDKVAEDRRRAGPPGLVAGGGGVVSVGCAPGPRLAAGDNPKGSHFGTHNGSTWVSSFQWTDFREQVPPSNFRFFQYSLRSRPQRGPLPRPAYFLLPAPPLAPSSPPKTPPPTPSGPAPHPLPPAPFHSIVGLSAPHSHRRPAGGGVRAWISPASTGQGQARSGAGGWTRGLQAASGRAAATPSWIALGGEAAAASALTWGNVGRRRSRWGSSSHLLASVSSDEVRYVNRFAAGKWRAGRRDPRGLRRRRRSRGGAERVAGGRLPRAPQGLFPKGRRSGPWEGRADGRRGSVGFARSPEPPPPILATRDPERCFWKARYLPSPCPAGAGTSQPGDRGPDRGLRGTSVLGRPDLDP